MIITVVSEKVVYEKDIMGKDNFKEVFAGKKNSTNSIYEPTEGYMENAAVLQSTRRLGEAVKNFYENSKSCLRIVRGEIQLSVYKWSKARMNNGSNLEGVVNEMNGRVMGRGCVK